MATNNARLKGSIAEREIFSALVAKDGRMGDMDQNARNLFCKEIFVNTRDYMLGRGILMPVKSGHDDLDESLKGYVMGLALKRRNYASVGIKGNSWFYSIYAKLFLRADLYEQYNSGEFPACSVEIAESGHLPDGTEFGTHLSAVALMGTTPAAMPYLQMQCDPGLFSLQKGKQIYKVVRVDTFAAAMDSKMDAKEFLKALEERMPTFLQSVLDELGGVESAPEEEVVIAEAKAETDAPPKPAAEEEKLAATKVAAGAELQALRAERAELQFSALHGKGNISTDEKAHFMKIAKAQGVDFAVEVYSKKSAQVPPGGERLGSGAGMDDLKVAEFKMAIEHATRFGLKDSNVIKHAASLAANQRN